MRWNRRVTIGMLAILSGGLAAYAALLYLQQRPIRIASAPTAPQTTPVVVAARNLQAGEMVGPDDIKLLNWPAKSLPEGFAGSDDDVLGRGLIRPVTANAPILKAELAGPGGGSGLSVTIPEGMRALSVKVDEVVGVAGFVLPGTHVDVISVIQSRGSSGPISRVILQNVPTLAAGQTTTTDETGKPLTVTVITLMVTPGDAEKLALAATQGRIQLALRNTLDQDTVRTNGVRVASLLTGPPQPRRGRRTSATPPRVVTGNSSIIEVFKGGVRTLIKF